MAGTSVLSESKIRAPVWLGAMMASCALKAGTRIDFAFPDVCMMLYAWHMFAKLNRKRL